MATSSKSFTVGQRAFLARDDVAFVHVLFESSCIIHFYSSTQHVSSRASGRTP